MGVQQKRSMWRWWRMVVLVAMVAAVVVEAKEEKEEEEEGPSVPVPKRVANRMVPSWWFKAAKKVCYSRSDCPVDECCTRPMLSVNAYCMPMRKRGQVCNAKPQLLNPSTEMYFNDCPCLPHYSCAALNLKGTATCVDLEALEVDFKRYVYNSFLTSSSDSGS